MVFVGKSRAGKKEGDVGGSHARGRSAFGGEFLPALAFRFQFFRRRRISCPVKRGAPP